MESVDVHSRVLRDVCLDGEQGKWEAESQACCQLFRMLRLEVRRTGDLPAVEG